MLLAAVLMLCTAGCSRKDYQTVAEAQTRLGTLSSAKLTVTATAETNEPIETIRTDFSFCYLADGALQFCQTQYDNAGKVTYCAYSAGTDVEQWLLGAGWETLQNAGYNKENPHRYLRLLSTPYDRDEVKTIGKETADGVTHYTLTLNADRLNEGRYAQEPLRVVEQTVTVSVSDEGQVTGYTETAVFRDTQTEIESRYRLEIAVSGHNETPPAQKPSLREYQR